MTTVYVDTSALLKRVFVEAESAAVTETLRRHAAQRDLLTTSSLTWVEVWRSLRRTSVRIPDLEVKDRADDALSGIAELPLTVEVLGSARTVGTNALRSLDAMHLASAMAAGADVLMTFDDRLAAAATNIGIVATAPR